METPDRPIVVGFDDSPDSRLALQWGLVEAAASHRPMRVVHSQPSLPHTAGSDSGVFHAEQTLRLLASARAMASHFPQVQVTTEHVEGLGLSPARALMSEARHAHLVVVGCRGHRPPAGLLLGSISEHLAAHAPCPVVTVRPARLQESGRVVVGVDGSSASERALGFAFEHAANRAVGVTAVHVWRDHSLADRAGIPLPMRRDLAADVMLHQTLLDAALEAWCRKYPDVPVVAETIPGQPARVLCAASEHASLIVVGSRDRWAPAGLGPTSVSKTVLHRAYCPVAVVG